MAVFADKTAEAVMLKELVAREWGQATSARTLARGGNPASARKKIGTRTLLGNSPTRCRASVSCVAVFHATWEVLGIAERQ